MARVAGFTFLNSFRLKRLSVSARNFRAAASIDSGNVINAADRIQFYWGNGTTLA
jgi:hypothetical protein